MAHLKVQTSLEEVLLFMDISQLYYSRGEYEKAEKVLRGALVLSPEDPDVYACLGAVCQVQGRWDEARDYYLHSLKGCPSEKCARSNLAHLLLMDGMTGEAEQELRQVLDDIDSGHPMKERAAALLQIVQAVDAQM